MSDSTATGAAAAASTTPSAGPANTAVAGGAPVVMPNQDLTVTEATVLRWLKAVGDRVRSGEDLVEVETAKATLVVECPADGTLAAIDVPEGAPTPTAAAA